MKINPIEVGPPAGLQSQAVPLPTANKVALIKQLFVCGIRRLEVTSFVGPRRARQMSDAEVLMSMFLVKNAGLFAGKKQTTG